MIPACGRPATGDPPLPTLMVRSLSKELPVSVDTRLTMLRSRLVTSSCSHTTRSVCPSLLTEASWWNESPSASVSRRAEAAEKLSPLSVELCTRMSRSPPFTVW